MPPPEVVAVTAMSSTKKFVTLDGSVVALNTSHTVCPRKAETSKDALCTQPEVRFALLSVVSVARRAPVAWLAIQTVMLS